MANRYRNLIYSEAEYTHLYRGFRGIELNASESTESQSRLAYSQNMYKDYDGNGSDVLESIPGFRCFAHYGSDIHALYYQRSVSGGEDHIIVHVKDRLMRHPISDIYRQDATGTRISGAKDSNSFGFEFGRHFYIMDGRTIMQISDSGSCLVIGQSGSDPYVPTTYISGEPYEQRNLLTNRFNEEYYVADPKAYLYKSKDLKFSITDPNLLYCSVKGISGTSGDVYIPAYVDIAGINHKVVEVESRAFLGNTSISAVYLPEGIIKIGDKAFEGCTSLNTVATPSTLTHIGASAFSGCSSLKNLYLGAALERIDSGAIDGCVALSRVNYALGATDLLKINGVSVITEKNVIYNSVYEALKLEFPFHDKVRGITEVKVNGNTIDWNARTVDSYFTSVNISLPSLADATGIQVVVSGELAPLEDGWSADMSSAAPESPYQVIVSCTIAEVFDGRIFFSGNPDFPNTVFYTERIKKGHEAALYVGRYNYFNDGIGSYKVKAMLAVRDMLAVFKEGDDGSGSIFYHKKEGVDSSAIDTVYPVAYVHSGICASGRATSFLDDPVFLTSEGLMALNDENITYQRNVVCRSHNVNYYLLKSDLSGAYLCEWLGYLAIGIDGRIFLADSRAVFTHHAGSREYEWFLLNDIGVYNNDKKVYRYSEDAYLDAEVHPARIGEAADYASVYSQKDDGGNTYFYVTENGHKYHVISTDEMSGGDFYPAKIFISKGKLLIFATSDGHLCVFNNDMRGIAPESVQKDKDYDADEYTRVMGNRLHPIYYSFAGHAPTYVIKTAMDDCGVPHLTKSTIKRSLVIKADSERSNAITCEAKSDNGDAVYVGSFPQVGSGFADLDFTSMPWSISKYRSVALAENEKRWIEKQIILTSSSYASPISVYSISYRYTIKGKIKNNA